MGRQHFPINNFPIINLFYVCLKWCTFYELNRESIHIFFPRVRDPNKEKSCTNFIKFLQIFQHFHIFVIVPDCDSQRVQFYSQLNNQWTVDKLRKKKLSLHSNYASCQEIEVLAFYSISHLAFALWINYVKIFALFGNYKMQYTHKTTSKRLGGMSVQSKMFIIWNKSQINTVATVCWFKIKTQMAKIIQMMGQSHPYNYMCAYHNFYSFCINYYLS